MPTSGFSGMDDGAPDRRRSWKCPSAEQVAAYLEQRLAADDKARFEAHLADCDFCLGLVSSLVRQEERGAEPVEVPARLMRQAIALAPEKRRAHSWRWAFAPALAAIVVVSAVLLKPPEPPPLVPPHVPVPAAETARRAVSAGNSRPSESRAPEVRSAMPRTRGLELLDPRSGSAVEGETLRFRWKAVAKADHYEIRVVNAEGDPVWRAESDVPTVQLPGNLSLRPGKYFVSIQAFLKDGRMLKSEAIPFRIRSSS